MLCITACHEEAASLLKKDAVSVLGNRENRVTGTASDTGRAGRDAVG